MAFADSDPDAEISVRVGIVEPRDLPIEVREDRGQAMSLKSHPNPDILDHPWELHSRDDAGRWWSRVVGPLTLDELLAAATLRSCTSTHTTARSYPA